VVGGFSVWWCLQCEPMNADNPRMDQSAIDILKKLLGEFDKIEESDPE